MTELHFAQEQLVYLISLLVNLPNCVLFTMMIWLPILSFDQITMHSNLGQLVGVEVTITVVVFIIVRNSGDAISVYESNKQWLSPEALATYLYMNENVKTVRENLRC